MVYSVLPEVLSFPWEVAYLNAILEADNSLLADRIEMAEETIQRRLWTLAQLQGNEKERALAKQVLGNLAVLRQERLATRMTNKAETVQDSPHCQD